jgi:two-component system, OmpR family, response regulator ResD
MRKIVLADDDPDIRELVTMILESQDCAVRAARNGAACLELLAAEQPDLLILDLLMPVMDGFSVCEEIRKGRFPGLPVLILSSVQEAASRGRYQRETGNVLAVAGFIEKPFSPGDLIQKIRGILGD